MQAAIIVLNYNGLDTTKKFIDHIYKNTQNFTLIMIDNGSTDGSVEYLESINKKYDNLILHLSKTNLGVINGRNKGYEIYDELKDKPNILGFLDNDQFVSNENWLDQHISVMNQSQAQIVGAEAWIMNKSYVPMRRCKMRKQPWTYVGCGGMFMLKEVPENIGMFDSRFNPCYFEDPDYCFRSILAGYKLSWNSQNSIIHLPHQTLGKNSNRHQLFKKSHKLFVEKWRSKNFYPTNRQQLVEALK